MTTRPEEAAERRFQRDGVLSALVAYLLWGVFPVYFKLVQAVPPSEVARTRRTDSGSRRSRWRLPPSQAETMVSALRAKGVPVAYLPFEGEQHGFRRAENIRTALDGEL